ncbi:TPA: FkbM family methyltransferase [Campylobacter jejuni]|nr:FkbM family methyltransferase [Campylobacter jejuni]HDZ5002600.1 FkbM family methyltransferase [Campylobacter jejuni]HDZ5014585.1 FkbM family methyltransferase [Campylobacter jejuni]HDZ5055624.1 FkbM family methyltransferase [Campylobacter jejuni]HDZ5134021.1 FkbM family methyltransferase [Campylobacter jejuni]
MKKEQLESLKEALNSLVYQIDNHQQARKPIADVERIISELQALSYWNKQENVYNTLNLIEGAIADPQGLGRLNLLLDNARIPKQYYDIFYNMLYINGGGGYRPICIDCGGHAGLITDIILHCGGQSYIFEPNIYLNYFLKKKYENNINVKLFQKAVSDRSYETDFIMFGNRILSQGNRIVESAQDDQTEKTYKVQVIDLCEFIENEILTQHKRIYFLKLDIEGAEFEIMKKIIDRKIYERIDYIACETHEYMFDDSEKKIGKLRQLIDKYNIQNILLDWI